MSEGFLHKLKDSAGKVQEFIGKFQIPLAGVKLVLHQNKRTMA